MKRRILAWIALVFLLLIIANILFIHLYVTESVTIYLLYVLVLYFGRNREHTFEGPECKEHDDHRETSETAEISETVNNTGNPE